MRNSVEIFLRSKSEGHFRDFYHLHTQIPQETQIMWTLKGPRRRGWAAHARNIDPSVWTFSLSLHRHPHICIPFTSHFYLLFMINFRAAGLNDGYLSSPKGWTVKIGGYPGLPGVGGWCEGKHISEIDVTRETLVSPTRNRHHLTRSSRWSRFEWVLNEGTCQARICDTQEDLQNRSHHVWTSHIYIYIYIYMYIYI